MPFAQCGPARGSECTRRAYFCAKRAIASISRGKSLLKNHKPWKVVAKIFMLLLCGLGGLARKISRDSSSPLAKSYGFFSQSRGVYWAAELLLLRIRARRETFGLVMSSQRWTNRQDFFFATPAENRFFSGEREIGRKEREHGASL